MSNVFTDAMEKKVAWKLTENGQPALNTTFDKCLDLFATIGAMRERSEEDIELAFVKAFDENPLIALRTLFYARDIKEGLGERRAAKVCLKWLAQSNPEIAKLNFVNVEKFGRYDDFYAFVGTPVEDAAFKYLHEAFSKDVEHCVKNEPISLLAKWLKSTNTSSEESKRLGRMTAKYFGLSEATYRRTLSILRKRLKVTEVDMSANKWEDIDFTKVPGGAMKRYTEAFKRHEPERFDAYIDAVLNNKTVVVNGKEVEAKMNTKNLMPYEIISTYTRSGGCNASEYKPELEAMWNNLKDVMQGEEYNGIVMADVSGSMTGKPMCSSIGLAIYFSEHNKGAYHNKFLTFSSRPSWVTLSDAMTLRDKINTAGRADWGGSTDLESAFNLILDVALENQLKQEDMPKSLIIVTDMEFNYACYSYRNYGSDMTFYDTMKQKYELAGYTIPEIIFWNVNARQDTFHTQSNTPHVAMVSGQAVNVFNDLIHGTIKTPHDYMLEVLGKERYDSVVVE